MIPSKMFWGDIHCLGMECNILKTIRKIGCLLAVHICCWLEGCWLRLMRCKTEMWKLPNVIGKRRRGILLVVGAFEGHSPLFLLLLPVLLIHPSSPKFIRVLYADILRPIVLPWDVDVDVRSLMSFFPLELEMEVRSCELTELYLPNFTIFTFTKTHQTNEMQKRRKKDIKGEMAKLHEKFA